MLWWLASRTVRPTPIPRKNPDPPEEPYVSVAARSPDLTPLAVPAVDVNPLGALYMTVSQPQPRPQPQAPIQAIVIGAGPAGLMAAEQLVQAGISVAVYDAMPSVGRKLLRAGIGGLNLTHAENKADFIHRYAPQVDKVGAWLQEFDADALRLWAADLGIETFVGSSGRVFPSAKKAAPLLRAWLHRLRAGGTQFHVRHRWCGWDDQGGLLFSHADKQMVVSAPVVIYALGGGSWARLGSDGQWRSRFIDRGIQCAPFRPSNGGFRYDWRVAFRAEQAGQPLKSVALALTRLDGSAWRKKGDAVIAGAGLEGSLIYAASAAIRDQIDQQGSCTVHWDLFPDKTAAQLAQVLGRRRAGDSLSTLLRRQLKLTGVKLALLKELSSKEQMGRIDTLPSLLKALPQCLTACRDLDEAISTAGGVEFDELTAGLMLRQLPGHFCVGEMLDWEAPTGGYLLTACYASGVVAGRAARDYLSERSDPIDNL